MKRNVRIRTASGAVGMGLLIAGSVTMFKVYASHSSNTNGVSHTASETLIDILPVIFIAMSFIIVISSIAYLFRFSDDSEEQKRCHSEPIDLKLKKIEELDERITARVFDDGGFEVKETEVSSPEVVERPSYESYDVARQVGEQRSEKTSRRILNRKRRGFTRL